MKELREIIAANICSLRTERKLTQIKLAEILNYSDKAVSKWERGESVPDITVLKQIADYFEVTVDYLLTEDHTDGAHLKKPNPEYTATDIRNHLIISGLAVLLVWLAATFAFVELNLSGRAVMPAWLTFIYAVPLSFTVALVFNSVWGIRRLNYLAISFLMWSLLLAVYLSVLTLLGSNVWLAFLLGVPAQLIILLCSGLKKRPSTQR